LSGTDVTGAFAGKGKLTWWKTFNSASYDVLQALSELGTSENVSPAMMHELEALVCQVYMYLPNTKMTDIGEVRIVRWWLFAKKQHQGGNLSPRFFASSNSHGEPAGAMQWYQDINQHPQLPSPQLRKWIKTSWRQI